MIEQEQVLTLSGVGFIRLVEILLNGDGATPPEVGSDIEIEDALAQMGLVAHDLAFIQRDLANHPCWICDVCGFWRGEWPSKPHQVMCECTEPVWDVE